MGTSQKLQHKYCFQELHEPQCISHIPIRTKTLNKAIRAKLEDWIWFGKWDVNVQDDTQIFKLSVDTVTSRDLVTAENWCYEKDGSQIFSPVQT